MSNEMDRWDHLVARCSQVGVAIPGVEVAADLIVWVDEIARRYARERDELGQMITQLQAEIACLEDRIDELKEQI